MNAPVAATKDIEIAFAATFQASLADLEGPQKVAVFDAIEKLQKGHGSVHVHALSPMPWVSFVVNRDAVRVICWREGNTLLLTWVALHEDAYRWAQRHEPLLEVADPVELVPGVDDLCDHQLREQVVVFIVFNEQDANLIRRLIHSVAASRPED